MIRAFVLGDAAIVAAVGTRVYPVKLPQNPTYPAMTIQRISGVDFPPLKGRASLARPRYQFDVWTKEGVGSAFETVQTVGQLLRDRLEGRNVDLLDASVSPAEYRRFSFEFDSDRDLFEPDAVSSGYYRYSADYFVMHQTGNGVT
jgi:hypothetical protein